MFSAVRPGNETYPEKWCNFLGAQVYTKHTENYTGKVRRRKEERKEIQSRNRKEHLVLDKEVN